MSIRDNLKEFLANKPIFQGVDDETKEIFLDEVSSKRSNLLEYLASDDEYLSLDEPTRREFLSGIAPEYFDTGAIIEVERPLTDMVVSGVKSQLGVQAAGLAQFAYDYNPAHISRKLAEYMGAEPNPESAALDASVQGSIAALRDMAVEEQKQYELGAKDMGFISRAGLDIGVDLLAAIPTIAAMFVGGPVTAGVMGAAQAGAVEYGDVRSKGYNPLEAGVKALPNMALAGLSAGVSAGIALDPSKPLMRRVMKNAIIDSGTGFTMPVVDAAADYLTDLVYKSKDQQPLLAPGTDPWQVVKNGLYGAFVNAGSGVFITAAPDMVRAVKMRVNGLKETTTKDGQVIIHPVEMTDHVDQMVANTSFDGLDAQQIYNRSAQALEAGARTAKRLDEITELQNSRPLDELDLDPQAGPSKKMGRLKVDMEVDVSPKYFTDMDNKPRNMGKPAKVVKNTYPVEQTVQTVPPGGVAPITQTKRNLFVDVEFPDEPGVTYTIPRKHIVEKTRTPNSAPHESARLVRFMSDLFFPRNIPVSEWSADNARMALGGFLSVNESLGRKALGQVKGTTGGIVWDAMRNNPEDAARILSHEPGHIFAEADPIVLKAMNVPEFDGFKQWITETTQTNDPAVLQRYQQAKQQNPDLTLEDFILAEKYGNELQQLWDGWSLFKSKTPNAREQAANALSVYMNDVLGPEALPGFRSMKIRADLSDWIDSQPNLKLAFEGLRAYDFAAPGSVSKYIHDVMRKGDEAISKAKEAQMGEDKTLLQELGDDFQNRLYSFLDRMRHDPAAVDRQDKSFMTPGRAAHFVDVGFGDTLKTLRDNGITFEDYNLYLYLKRIENDRTKTVERLSQESQYEDMGKYQKAFELESQRVRDDIIDNNPDFTDAEVQAAVQAHMKQFAESNVVEEYVNLLNPGGVTVKDASVALGELSAKLGPDKMAVLENRRQAEHDAWVKWGIPVLRESKLFSERQLNHMENNSDYTTFVIAHHAFKARNNRGQNKGSLDFIHEQMGTTGFLASPHAQTTELRARMIMAADQAGMQRDLIDMSADFEAKHYPDAPRTRRISAGDELPVGYEEFKTRKYNNATGRVEDVRYAVRKGTIDGFYNTAKIGGLFSGLSAIHGTMKGWMTIYNPKFWFTNFVRDVARTAINAPGFGALYQIPYESTKAGLKDFAARARGMDNPEYQDMLLNAQLAGDVKGQHQMDKNMSTHDRVMMMADLDPRFFGKTWGEIDGFMDKLKYTYSTAAGIWKKGSAAIGGSVEFASKAGMKRYLDKNYPKMSKEEKNWYIRNAAGTPVLGRSGNWNPYLSNMLLFYNPNMQGYAGDWQAFKRDPIANTLKRMTTIAPYMMLIGAAKMGLLGEGQAAEDLKKWVENIPKAYFGRGFVLPTGFSADGDSGTFIVPTDPATRMLLSASYQTINKLQNGTFNPVDIGGSILGEAAEGLPSVTPVGQSVYSAYQYMAGENPQDFMGREAIDPTVFASDKNWRKRMSMLTHIAQQGWGGPLNALGFTNLARLNLETRTPKARIEDQTSVQKVNTLMKDFTGVPVIGYPLAGLFKFTSAGIRELAEERAAPTQQKFNSDRDTIRRSLNNLLSGEAPTAEELLLMADERHESYIQDFLKDAQEQKAVAALNRPDLLQPLRLLQQNPNRDVKMELLKIIAERMNKK